MSENNKVYSNRQEKMVSSALGWKQVSGSGSRPFHVGDVVSDEWLGECKTHTKSGCKISFKHTVWYKLRLEAKSCNRYAVYFVDDGSQTSDKTYCIISYIANPFNIADMSVHKLDDKYVTVNGNISFCSSDIEDVIYSSVLYGERVILMSFRRFVELVG